MKIWIKLLVGSVLGIALGLFAPDDNAGFLGVFAWLDQFALSVGRYAVVPMLVFSLTIGIYELRQDARFWPLVLKNGIVIIGVSAFVIFAGVFATLAFPPSRIPILAEEQLEAISLDIPGGISELFPHNMFSVFAGDGAYLFPLCVFAFFLGMGLSCDKNFTKPVIALVDSLSRVFYHIASFFVEIFGFLMIVLSAQWMIQFREVLRTDIFSDLMLLLGILGAVLGFGILPLFLYLSKLKVNPAVVVYGYLGPAIAAFFSGDINFSLPVMIRHAKENFGVKRKSNAVSFALFGTFCRAGSAMVAAVAFMVIIRSNSSLGMTTAEIFSTCLRALGISFLLARYPGNGAYIALALLCAGYGGGLETHYLILKPMAFYLIAIGTFLDTMIASFGAYVTARLSGYTEEKPMSRFI
jgi:Na+/H+-dicarboxylate symporter